MLMGVHKYESHWEDEVLEGSIQGSERVTYQVPSKTVS